MQNPSSPDSNAANLPPADRLNLLRNQILTSENPEELTRALEQGLSGVNNLLEAGGDQDRQALNVAVLQMFAAARQSLTVYEDNQGMIPPGLTFGLLDTLQQTFALTAGIDLSAPDSPIDNRI